MKKIRFECIIDDSEIHTEAYRAKNTGRKLKYKAESNKTNEGVNIALKPKCSK